jgi:hypothetical protein
MPRMYIRIAQVTFDPSHLDEALVVIREHGLPIMRAAGVAKVYVAVDSQSGRATVVSTWDTLEHASFVNPPDFLARFEGLGMHDVQQLTYEVTDQA